MAAHVLVTGAGGFSGPYIVSALLDAGHRVTAVAGRSSKRLASITDRPGLDTVVGDIAQGLPVLKGVRAVVHAAAVSPGPGVTTTVRDFIHNNVVATARVAAGAAASGVELIIFLSSISAFGRVTRDVVNETCPVTGADAYGASKLLGEMVLAEGPFASLSLRLPAVIGPRAVRNWLATMVEASRAGREVTYFNGNAPFNNAVHVADLTRLIVGLVHDGWRGHDMVTMAAAGTMPVQEVVETIVAAGGGQSATRAVPSQRTSFTISSERAMARYGYAPMEIRDMVRRFLRENGLDQA